MAGRGTTVWVDIPDLHLPWHDPTALEVAKKVIDVIRPNGVIVGGDMLDCGGFSRHLPKSLREAARRDWLEHEVKPGRELLDYIQSRSRHLVFLAGNHEDMPERWAANDPTAAQAFSCFDPARLLMEGRSHATWVPHRDKPGVAEHNSFEITPELELSSALVSTHGWSHAKAAAAKHLDLAGGKSIIFHHVHRAQSFVDRNPWTGKRIEASSAGCLCNLNQWYTGPAPTSWVHGLTVVWVGRRSWTKQDVAINGNSCVIDGREYRV